MFQNLTCQLLGIQAMDLATAVLATLVASIMFLTSIQLIAIGVLSEYVGRVFEQTKGRPQFIVREASLTDRTPR